MNDPHSFRRSLRVAQAAFLALALILVSRVARAQNYGPLVAMLRSQDRSVRDKAKETLVRTIKDNLLRKDHVDPEQYTSDVFMFGHFVSAKTDDLAVGISVPPNWGHLVILTEKDGWYVPAGPVIDTDLIQSIEPVKLIPGSLDQMILNDYSNGTGWLDWGKYIFRWDGSAMRIIWMWERKTVYKGSAIGPNGECTGQVTRARISIGPLERGRARQIVTSSEEDRGVFSDQKGREWELKKVRSRSKLRLIHRWDGSLYYYVAKWGTILPSQITVSCSLGQSPYTLHAGMKVGLLETPGTISFNDKGYYVVVGKEHFCEIPESAVVIDRQANKH